MGVDDLPHTASMSNANSSLGRQASFTLGERTSRWFFVSTKGGNCSAVGQLPMTGHFHCCSHHADVLHSRFNSKNCRQYSPILAAAVGRDITFRLLLAYMEASVHHYSDRRVAIRTTIKKSSSQPTGDVVLSENQLVALWGWLTMTWVADCYALSLLRRSNTAVIIGGHLAMRQLKASSSGRRQSPLTC